jgi:hypothetical protein
MNSLQKDAFDMEDKLNLTYCEVTNLTTLAVLGHIMS